MFVFLCAAEGRWGCKCRLSVRGGSYSVGRGARSARVSSYTGDLGVEKNAIA